MSRVLLPAELRTERLLLRQWRPEDVEPLAEIYAQPEYLEHMSPLDVAGTAGQIQRFASEWRHEGFSHWAAEDRETGRLIGRIGLLRHHDWPLSQAPVEVGWTLHRGYWGRGLATEGGRAAMHCWRELLLDDRQLISITTPANVRSRAVMERLGLTFRGTVRWRALDVVWCAIDRRPAARQVEIGFGNVPSAVHDVSEDVRPASDGPGLRTGSARGESAANTERGGFSS